jgi:hypothetical protein
MPDEAGRRRRVSKRRSEREGGGYRVHVCIGDGLVMFVCARVCVGERECESRCTESGRLSESAAGCLCTVGGRSFGEREAASRRELQSACRCFAPSLSRAPATCCFLAQVLFLEATPHSPLPPSVCCVTFATSALLVALSTRALLLHLHILQTNIITHSMLPYHCCTTL